MADCCSWAVELWRQDIWINVDKEKCKQIDTGSKRLKLQPGTKGYAFTASQYEKIAEIFSLLGRIDRSSSCDAFLAQLADFDKIEDVDLPASLRPGITFHPYQKKAAKEKAATKKIAKKAVKKTAAKKTATKTAKKKAAKAKKPTKQAKVAKK